MKVLFLSKQWCHDFSLGRTDLKSDEPNTMVEHLTKGHFQNAGAFSGVKEVARRIAEENLMKEFKTFDVDGSGLVSVEELCIFT